jgi:hypothetical protein
MTSVVLSGETSGSGTITVPDVAGTFTATMGSATGTHYPFSSGTAVASTSGTSIDFTNIPSWVKRVTVEFNDVSTNGSSPVQVQIGSGSVTTTGYVAYSAYVGATTGASSATTGMLTFLGASDARRIGHMVFTNVSGNVWVSSHAIGTFSSSANFSIVGGGNVTLSGTLDRLRITTVNGTDAFDAGSINILYE